MVKTLNDRLTELNDILSRRTPGYKVEVNALGKFEWFLVGPSGKAHFTRDTFDAIEAIALRLRELTFRARGPQRYSVKCPKITAMIIVERCRRCNYYIDEGYRVKKGQNYIVCSYKK